MDVALAAALRPALVPPPAAAAVAGRGAPLRPLTASWAHGGRSLSRHLAAREARSRTTARGHPAAAAVVCVQAASKPPFEATVTKPLAEGKLEVRWGAGQAEGDRTHGRHCRAGALAAAPPPK